MPGPMWFHLLAAVLLIAVLCRLIPTHIRTRQTRHRTGYAGLHDTGPQVRFDCRPDCGPQIVPIRAIVVTALTVSETEQDPDGLHWIGRTTCPTCYELAPPIHLGSTCEAMRLLTRGAVLPLRYDDDTLVASQH